MSFYACFRPVTSTTGEAYSKYGSEVLPVIGNKKISKQRQKWQMNACVGIGFLIPRYVHYLSVIWQDSSDSNDPSHYIRYHKGKMTRTMYHGSGTTLLYSSKLLYPHSGEMQILRL